MRTLGYLAPWIKPHRRALLAAALLGLVAAASGLLVPWATKVTIDRADDVSSLVGPVIVLAAVVGLGLLVGLAQRIVLARVSENVVRTARMSMVDRVLAARVNALNRYSSGELVARVTNDPQLLRDAAGPALVGVFSSTITVIGAVVLMAVLDWVLLLTALVTLLALGLLVGLTLRPLRTAYENAQAAVARLGTILEGAVRAVRSIKVSNATDRVRATISTEATAANRFAVRAVWLESAGLTIVSTGVQLTLVAVLGVGAWRVADGALGVSSLVAFLLYVVALIQPVSDLSRDIAALSAGRAAASRIAEVTGLPVERSHGVEPTGTTLSMRGVTVRYPDAATPALSVFDCDFPERGQIALVGPSGAGKTTVVSVLLGLLDPAEGEVCMNGLPYPVLSLEAIRARIAYAEQDSPLVPGTVRDNLLLRTPGASDDELREVLHQVRLLDWVDRTPGGLDAEVSSTALSGGERQRLGLARVLLRPPPVLLLDEPTAQLDAITERAISGVVARCAESGLVLTIAHRLSTVIDADQIVVMDRGRVRDRGHHAELLARDSLYAQLVAALRITEGQTQGFPSAEGNEAVRV